MHLKIGCYKYTVRFTFLHGDARGFTELDQCEIHIDNALPLQVQRETLLHELLHVCLDDCPVIDFDNHPVEKREEDLVSFISPRLFQILLDNQWLRDFLFNKDDNND